MGYVLAGHSARSAARVFGVSPSTAVRLACAHRRKGSVAPKPQWRRPGAVGKLAPHFGFLTELIKSDPDITLRELSGALEDARRVQVRLSSIHRALVGTGYSY